MSADVTHEGAVVVRLPLGLVAVYTLRAKPTAPRPVFRELERVLEPAPWPPEGWEPPPW